MDASNVKSKLEEITSCLVSVTRSASQVSSQDLGFHRAASDQFSKSLEAQNQHLLRLTNRLLKVTAESTKSSAPSLKDKDAVEDKFKDVIGVIDNLLEKADASIDEFNGVFKAQSPAISDNPDQPPAKKARINQPNDQWSHASITKPQTLFIRPVNNYEAGPWKPLLRTKPNAIIPLDESIGSGNGGYKHPYAHEIETMKFPNSMYEPTPPKRFTPPEQSQAVFVDTEEGVRQMLEELKTAKEIAIDLEHNDKNSYIGLVCLMQISTRNKDWIIDTLKPWRENLQTLNEVFTDPKIIKVLHGSASDIIWLQRDLGLYIVGLFDTFYASSALQFPAKSLRYLLQRFANFDAQKQYQMSDWRVRPLPQELLDYARSDTHYLLYVFDCLKVMLIEASSPRENLIDRVLESSRGEALQTYVRSVYNSDTGLGSGGWLKLLMTRNTEFSNEQFGVFRALHGWRDEKARELDEGEQNIMPNTMLFTYADIMPTRRPAFFQRGLGGRLPQHVAENIPELCEVIKKGREEGKEGLSIYEAISKHGDKVGFMYGRNKHVKKTADNSPARGVGATLQLLNGTGELSKPQNVIADDSPAGDPIAARSITSQLFGHINPSSILPAPNHAVEVQALQTVLPLNFSRLPQPIPEIPSAQVIPTSLPVVQQDPVINGTSQVNGQQANTFTIKDQSRKRKADEVIESNVEVGSPLETKSSHISSLPDDASTEPRQHVDLVHRDEKRARKAEKKAKKAAEAAERKAAQENIIPFDYANANSILHAKPEPVDMGLQNPGKVKPLNPFIKAMDTTTGAKRSRMGKELAGKSHTFTS